MRGILLLLLGVSICVEGSKLPAAAGAQEPEDVKLLRKAADQGDAKAQFSLGGCYALGRGVPQYHFQAYIWVNLAASSLDSAREARDLVATFLSPDQLRAAQQAAAKLFEELQRRKASQK